MCLQVDLLMSERKEAKEAVQAQADGMKAAQVRSAVLRNPLLCAYTVRCAQR